MRSPVLAPPAPPLTGWRLWLQATRPRTLPLAATPVLLGTALAAHSGQPIDGAQALVALLCTLLIQIGTNLYNDAADGESGADGGMRLGPLRITAAGWATARAVRRAAYVCLAGAFVLGIFLALAGGWPIVAIGLLSLAAALAYSAGPWPISHSPWGEVFAGLFFGPVAILGMQVVLGAPLNLAALLAGTALGTLSAAVLMVNNLRDRASDSDAGRRTLAIVIGPRASRQVYRALIATPLLLLPAIAHASAHSGPWLTCLALPAFIALLRHIGRRDGLQLNQQLAATAQASALYGVLMAIGLVWL